MKRFFCLLLVLLLFAACAPKTETEQPTAPDEAPVTTDYSSKVYTVDNRTQNESDAPVWEVRLDSYGSNDVKHFYDIAESVTESHDEAKFGQEKTAVFLGETYRMTHYYETIEYKTESIKADKYLAAGTTHGGDLLLTENGEILALLFPVLKLDIRPSDPAETVRAAVEDALKSEIDFSQFQGCSVYNGLTARSEKAQEPVSDFLSYRFVWYRQKGPYMTDDFLKAVVHSDGTVDGIWMKQRAGYSFEAVPDELSIETYLPQIEQKLKQIYTQSENKTELRNFSFQEILITVFEGQYCFDCRIGVRYLQGENEQEWSELCDLIVPIGIDAPAA